MEQGTSGVFPAKWPHIHGTPKATPGGARAFKREHHFRADPCAARPLLVAGSMDRD